MYRFIENIIPFEGQGTSDVMITNVSGHMVPDKGLLFYELMVDCFAAGSGSMSYMHINIMDSRDVTWSKEYYCRTFKKRLLLAGQWQVRM